MGIFGKRRSREEKAAEIVEQVAGGKGFYGRMTRAILGAEDCAGLQQPLGAAKSGATADPVTLQTVVSKPRIPRAGDQVLVIADPANPGGYLYAGDGTTP
ncbi:hypothetical protein [Streptomyces sp. YU58]|uniref:hypothetical protein n=1 Tax=Streptomyces sp. SX92 TaxID=3158972 RepID=UPI0027BAFDF4|nr:hypothetical protein [Streptomyces coralus]WLW56804.1 hypothetical protein QU709_37995 [Streptomyces coralus]